LVGRAFFAPINPFFEFFAPPTVSFYETIPLHSTLKDFAFSEGDEKHPMGVRQSVGTTDLSA
jgi:hypothetical protein